VLQTNFSNPEAVGFLADRLARLGVEDRLFELGAREGDTVVIGVAPGTTTTLWSSTGSRRSAPAPSTCTAGVGRICAWTGDDR